MGDSYRGFTRAALLSRARLVAEENDFREETLDLLDEMDGWNAMSLYQWLYENDASFEAEARARIVSKNR